MKRCWIGAGLLGVLLLVGIFSTWRMQETHDPMASALKQACALAQDAQWEEAEYYVNWAKEEWEDGWGFTASLSDHEPMEQINVLFSQLEVSGQARETVSFCLLCAQLWEELEAMGEAHKFVWWNLL